MPVLQTRSCRLEANYYTEGIVKRKVASLKRCYIGQRNILLLIEVVSSIETTDLTKRDHSFRGIVFCVRAPQLHVHVRSNKTAREQVDLIFQWTKETVDRHTTLESCNDWY